MIRSAFFGTPHEAVPTLAALCDTTDVSFVVTQPDRPRGRSGTPQPPPVKEAALDRGLAVLQPGKVRELGDHLAGVDVAVVAAYGRIIPASLLSVPAGGFVNIHFSLLPRWRGASPVVRAILAGDTTTGVTLMQMDAGLDTGPILVTSSTPIGEDETAGELTGRLAALGGDLIGEHLERIVSGEVAPQEQDDNGATAAGKVTVEEAFVSPGQHGAVAVHRAIRAFNPRPGAWGIVDGERLKLWTSSMTGPAASADPGLATVVHGAVMVTTRDGALRLLEVQPAGRPRMDAIAWMNGRRGEPARFEPA